MEDQEHQRRAQIKCVLPDYPHRRLVGGTGKQHHMGQTVSAPERLVEPDGHLLEATETQAIDSSRPPGGQCRGEPRPVLLENAQRYRNHDV
jgi:hypothetical protein